MALRGNIGLSPSLPSGAEIQGIAFMDQSQAGAAQPLSRVALGLFATVAGSITLAWFAFLVWLGFKGFGVALTGGWRGSLHLRDHRLVNSVKDDPSPPGAGPATSPARRMRGGRRNAPHGSFRREGVTSGRVVQRLARFSGPRPAAPSHRALGDRQTNGPTREGLPVRPHRGGEDFKGGSRRGRLS